MNKPFVIPKIIYVGMFVMIFAAIMTTGSYYFETKILQLSETPMFDLFSDAFKVGLGAFIGVISQWASQVFQQTRDKSSETEPVREPNKAA